MKDDLKKASAPGFLARLGILGRKWRKENVTPSQDIDEGDTVLYGAGMTTAAVLLGAGRKKARSRQIIYEKWTVMESDPIISSALMLLCTSALGGHETSGDLVFIEESPVVAEQPKLKTVVEELSASLSPLFNKIAYQIAYTGCVYGDSYARIYTRPREGVIEITSDELIRPQLVQPFEKAGRTVGYAVYVGPRNFERLDVTQLARFKMPRTQWIPQLGVIEKSMDLVLQENNYESVQMLPSLVGGSLLYNAEEPWEHLIASLLGLVGQRWIDSIDEQILTVNLESTTKEQQKQYLESVKRLLTTSKQYAEQAVKQGSPILERIRHIIPVYNEKQMTQIMGPMGNGRTSNISIDDIMLHARLLAGALGVDLSMIGFADQMSGGLGEGGFFRTSAQVAERARVIRVALTDFFNSVIDIHTLAKYGIVFEPKNRPWKLNYYGSISALEAERARTKNDAMNAGGILVQTMQVFKDMGADKEMMRDFLCKTMQLDEEQAELYSRIVEVKKDEEEGGNGSPFGRG